LFNKTGNHFVECGYLPLNGLCDIMSHVAAVLKRKAAGKVKLRRQSAWSDPSCTV